MNHFAETATVEGTRSMERAGPTAGQAPRWRWITSSEVAESRAGCSGAWRRRWIIEWNDGLFRRVIGPTGFDKLAAEQKAEDFFLALLKRFNDDGRNVSDSPGANYAPVIFSKLPDSKGITKEALLGAMERLFEKNAIRVAYSGPPSRQTKRLVPA
jgi:hypothetical protein